MKRLVLTVLLALSCTIIIALIIYILIPKPKITYDQSAKTLVVKGSVKIKKSASNASWQDMGTSTLIDKGDTIETSEGGTVDVIMGSEAQKTIRLDEKSRLEIQEVNPANLNLSKGKVSVAIKKLEPKSSFIVKTPLAICGARGTAWSVAASQDKAKFCVFESKIFVEDINANKIAGFGKCIVEEGTQRTLAKGKPIDKPQRLSDTELEDWKYWGKSVEYLRNGRLLIDDFNKKENFNNLGGQFGSWVVFYSDANQYCRDEFTAFDRLGDTGYGLKLSYDVDSPFSAYNGFFTNLMGIDLTGYKYLVFHAKGDKRYGFTTKLNIELKNKFEIGKLEFDGITEEWQKVIISLDKFSGLTSLKNMKELVLVFRDLNATKKIGVIYIDDIYFSRVEEAATN